MKKKFQISIPDPCHENWDQMNPAEKGRFCKACQKTVVDFTGMSDAQLVAFFKKPSTGSVCGRFMNDQLEREIALPGKRIPWLKYYFQFSIPVFLASMKTQAQGKVMLKEKEEVVCISEETVGKTITFIEEQKEVSHIIKGRVVDDSGNGIAFASVILKGSPQGVVCDNSGFFSFKFTTTQTFITLESSSVGYETVERMIDLRLKDTVNVILQYNPVLNGEVLVGAVGMVKKGGIRMGAYSSIKTSFTQKLSEWMEFKKDTASIFPNPVRQSQPVTIEFSSMNDQQLRVMMVSIDGKLVDEKNFAATKGINRFQFSIDPKITAGIYIVAIKNEKGILIKREKIVVQ